MCQTGPSQRPTQAFLAASSAAPDFGAPCAAATDASAENAAATASVRIVLIMLGSGWVVRHPKSGLRAREQCQNAIRIRARSSRGAKRSPPRHHEERSDPLPVITRSEATRDLLFVNWPNCPG